MATQTATRIIITIIDKYFNYMIEIYKTIQKITFYYVIGRITKVNNNNQYIDNEQLPLVCCKGMLSILIFTNVIYLFYRLFK